MAGCVVDRPCPPDGVGLCVGDQVYACTVLSAPSAVRDCAETGDHCVDTGDRGECASASDATPLGWRPLPGGTYWMGPTGNATVPVSLAGFEMLATEVTVAQYRSCIAAGACRSPANQDCAERWHADLPVRCVDGIEADAFCRWIGGRLPSEAEWEYALRNAGEDVEFPWGNEPPQCARAILWDEAVSPDPGCGRSEPWPGCSRTPDISGQGICDLVGNVDEWVVAGSGLVQSRLPTRGACYLSSYMNFTLRHPSPPASPDESSISIGFRCVR
jgi:hypothetical protein